MDDDDDDFHAAFTQTMSAVIPTRWERGARRHVVCSVDSWEYFNSATVTCRMLTNGRRSRKLTILLRLSVGCLAVMTTRSESPSSS